MLHRHITKQHISQVGVSITINSPILFHTIKIRNVLTESARQSRQLLKTKGISTAHSTHLTIMTALNVHMKVFEGIILAASMVFDFFFIRR